ncbi:hypothetical protein DDE20_05835 [Pararhodobacter oceanensis]|uniref:VanZ-like domain-containing protein n=2 Tax=Pararhodobacter oceanensis TaxID=2172121 RepID=A0A2T8HW44_9RHOB|nr:hypothetical protein DDE20_05835 [Pararhodobacter oceanensis]
MGESNTAVKEQAARRETSAATLGALKIHQTWMWRKSGLVLSFMIALATAVLSLTAIPPEAISIEGLDKAYHFAGFLLIIFPLIVTDSRRWYWAVPLVILYGGAIELIQPTVGRSAEWLDFGANVTGVLAGAALAEILHDRIHRSVFDESPLSAQEQAAREAEQMEAVRRELMDELRVVLREELGGVPHAGPERPVGPSPAEDAAAQGAGPEGQAPVRLSVVGKSGGRSG